MTPSAMTTMITMTTIRTITEVSFGEGGRVRVLGYRAGSGGQTPASRSGGCRSPRNGRDPLEEQRGRVEERTDLCDRLAVRVHHQVLRAEHHVVGRGKPQQGVDH